MSIRLFVIGDSISIHYGPSLERFLPAHFHYRRKTDSGAERADENLDMPAGANGGDSRMVLEYLRRRRAHAPIGADVLLVNCGLHDIKIDVRTGEKQVAPVAYEQNLRAIFEEAARAGWRPVWVRTTPVIDDIHNQREIAIHRHASDVAAYNAVADRLMVAAGIPMIDLHSFSETFLPEGFCDHVHYTEEVRELQGAFIAGALSALFPAP